MCEAAPAIIDLLDRMGVMFNRTPEGLLDFRRFGGTLYHRTAFAGATTGQQLLYALDEQVRRFESEDKIKKFEGWTFLSAVIDDGGVARGICAMDLKTMEIQHVSGGWFDFLHRRQWRDFRTFDEFGGLHRLRAVGTFPAGRLLREWRIHSGASNGDSRRGQVPVDERIGARRGWARVGAEATRAISASGKDIPESERFYFLEEWYPKYGNLVPRDVATRAIHKIVFEMKMGLADETAVYLDVSHIPARCAGQEARRNSRDLREVRWRRPAQRADESFPGDALHHGRLWVDNENQATNVPGIYAAGECEYQYHGANRLGANSLVSCIYARNAGRAGSREVCAQPGAGRREHAGKRVRARTRPAAGHQRRAAQPAPGNREPHNDLARDGRSDDGERHRNSLQCKS